MALLATRFGVRNLLRANQARTVPSQLRAYAVAREGTSDKPVDLPTSIDISDKIPHSLDKNGKRKEKLVILGSGWAGYTLLRSIDKEKYDTFLVSPNTYFAMTPLLPAAATGSLEFRNVLEPVRETADTYFYHSWCDRIDFAQKKVHLTPAYPPPFRGPDPFESGSTIPNTRGGYSSAMVRPPHRRTVEGSDENPESDASRHHSQDAGETWKSQELGRTFAMPYDKLIIACGAYNRTFGVEGVRDNAFFLKDVQNARAIRWRILEVFEQAEHPHLTDEQRRNLLNFIIVGGGPTGAEFAAALYDLIHTDLKKIFPTLAPLAKIAIYDAAGSILNSFDQSLQDYARQQFDRDGIELKLNRKPKKVDRGVFEVEPDGKVNFGLLVWSTGNCQGPLVRGIHEIAKDQSGSLLTNGRLETILSDGDATDSSSSSPAKLLPDVFALGDCAQVDGYALPATAQVASQKAAYLAKLLNGTLKEGSEFRWKDKGSMANLSSGRGIAQVGKGKIEGRPASALWHSTYSLYLSVSLRNKISIPLTWLFNKLFGRTLSRM
ncbi:unnamed protein product [Sympodiomycopsis kandeliae]